MIEAGGNRVRCLDAEGKCYATAARSTPGNTWFVRELVIGKWREVGRISGKQPEVRQRKIVLAIMKEMER
jgi:hypothetical protein